MRAHLKHLAMRAYLEAVDVHALVDSKNSCEEKVDMLEKIVNTGMDTLLPMRSKTVVINEPPWVNQSLKKMIRGRQKALAQGDFVTFRILRNRINRERKTCRAKYYDSKVRHLKDCEPANWWKEVKKLSGNSAATSQRVDPTSILQYINCGQEEPTPNTLANVINKAFLLPMCDFTPLTSNSPAVIDHDCSLIVTEESTFSKLAFERECGYPCTSGSEHLKFFIL